MSARASAALALLRAAHESAGAIPLSRAAGPILRRTCACGGTLASPEDECEGCRAGASPLRRQASGGPAPMIAPPIVHEVLRSPGRPLDPVTRLGMEARLGHDFGRVRLHDDARAAASARVVGAVAYTVGHHVVFGARRYSPDTPDGRALLAHELAHTVQQSATPYDGGPIPVGPVHDPAEREADEAASPALMGAPVILSRRRRPVIQGRWDWKRAGIGAAIGGAAGLVAGGLLNLALGPALLLGGLGALLGGVFGGSAFGHSVAGCDDEKKKRIVSSLRLGLAMLQGATAALTEAGGQGSGSARAGRAQGALHRFFASRDPRVANHVRLRLGQVKDLMSTLLHRHRPAAPLPDWKPTEAPAMSCHSEQDDENCKGANAYTTAVDPALDRREGMVFCPSFFKMPTDRERAGTIIHESAHALLGGPAIGDIAYRDRGYFSDLSTAEALVNADSYMAFVLQVTDATGGLEMRMFRTSIQNCGPETARVEDVVRQVHRWIDVAQFVMTNPGVRAAPDIAALLARHAGSGDALAAAATAYDSVSAMLRFLVVPRCHAEHDAACPPGVVTAFEPTEMALLGTVHLCPDWLAEASRDRRAVFVLQALLEGAGVSDPARRVTLAQMAQELHATVHPQLVPPVEATLQSLEAPRGGQGAAGAGGTPPLQRSGATTAAPALAPPIVHDVLQAPGRALEPRVRAEMEDRLGHDFGTVRIHDDPQAARSARAVGAHAYTVGRDVVFGAGRYAPRTAEGRALLTHELTHVVQQSARSCAEDELRLDEATSAAEREADEAARRADGGAVPAIARRGGLAVQGRWDWARAGLGALIGGAGAFAAGRLLGLALGPAALLGGIGALLGGAFAGRALGGGIGGCTADQERAIVTALRLGLSMLRSAIGALASAIGALTPAAGASTAPARADRTHRARAALQRYFRSSDGRVAHHVRERLTQSRDLMTTLLQRHRPGEPSGGAREAEAPALSCQPAGDDCTGVSAYVTAVDPATRRREGMVFCPHFFDKRDEGDRAGTIIHEATHALLGGPHIKDVAYADRRIFAGLTTEEALVNADSYRLFVQHVAGTGEPSIPDPRIPSASCSAEGQRQIDAIGMRARRWASFAGRFTADRNPKLLAEPYWAGLRRRFLGGDSPALLDAANRAYGRAAALLELIIFGQCHEQRDAVCPEGTTATWEREGITGTIHVCPDWLAERDPDRQTLAFLRAIIEGSGEADAGKQLAYAQMARVLYADIYESSIPALEDIVGPATDRPVGDFPERVMPPGVEVA